MATDGTKTTKSNNMDTAIKVRASVRGVFTKKANGFESLLEEIKAPLITDEQFAAVNAEYKAIKEMRNKLVTWDDKICAHMQTEFEEEKFEKEIEDAGKYTSRWFLIESKFDLFQSSFMKNQKQNGGQEPKSPKTKLRLPKLEIAKFSGNLKEWLPFWSQFRKIHEDDSIDSECKFVYLLQSI